MSIPFRIITGTPVLEEQALPRDFFPITSGEPKLGPATSHVYTLETENGPTWCITVGREFVTRDNPFGVRVERKEGAYKYVPDSSKEFLNALYDRDNREKLFKQTRSVPNMQVRIMLFANRLAEAHGLRKNNPVAHVWSGMNFLAASPSRGKAPCLGRSRWRRFETPDCA